MALNKQAVNSKQDNQLPKFNKTISIEIEVDDIHKKLLEQFPEDYKHRDIVSHAIIGSAPNLSYIYNALNGYTNDIDFKEGDIVICTQEERYERYDANIEKENGEPTDYSGMSTSDPEYRPNWKYREVQIGECVVNNIDMYSNKKLLVQYMSYNRYSGKEEMREEWVNHKKCTRTGGNIHRTSPQVVENQVAK